MKWLAVLVRRIFQVATITDRTGTHYYVTWAEGDAVAARRWRWWNPRDLPWFRGSEGEG